MSLCLSILGSMVALETLPMHLPLFPKLWLELNASTEESAKEFINLLCTNCTNFRDYLQMILFQERSYLFEDYVFELLKIFVPKVSNNYLCSGFGNLTMRFV